MRRCERCGLTEGRFGVSLGAGGVCNYCVHWREQAARLGDYDALAPLLADRIARVRGRYPYDALVGFSGGKDSTYVVDSLARKHGLRVLALTFDNGFLTELANRNIKQVVASLGIDHVFHKPDWELHRLLYRAALETYGDPCVACAIPLYFYTLRLAFERRIPLVVHGRSPFQIYRNYYRGSPDIFLELHESNYHPHSVETLTRIYGRFDEAVRQWLAEMFPHDAERRDRAYKEFFLDPTRLDGTFAPDFVGLFQYERYDEEVIKRKMEAGLDYKRPTDDRLLGHGDCGIHDACAYLFRRVHGTSAIEVEIAAMVRHGLLERDMAERLLSATAAQEEARPDAALERLLSAVDLSRKDFELLADSLKQRLVSKFPCH